MMSQTIFPTIEKVKGGRWKQTMAKNGGCAQIVVVLTNKETSYFMLGMLDDLVGPLIYLYV